MFHTCFALERTNILSTLSPAVVRKINYDRIRRYTGADPIGWDPIGSFELASKEQTKYDNLSRLAKAKTRETHSYSCTTSMEFGSFRSISILPGARAGGRYFTLNRIRNRSRTSHQKAKLFRLGPYVDGLLRVCEKLKTAITSDVFQRDPIVL